MLTGTLGVLVARPMGRAKPRARPRGLAGDRAAQTPILTGLCATCREPCRTPGDGRRRKAKPARFRGPVRSSPIVTGSNHRIWAAKGVPGWRSLVNRPFSARSNPRRQALEQLRLSSFQCSTDAGMVLVRGTMHALHAVHCGAELRLDAFDWRDSDTD